MSHTQQLPHRFREDQFRRYESRIIATLERLPVSTPVSLQGLSPATVAARMRDAITSFLTNNWVSPLNGREDQVLTIVVAERDGGVVAGTKESLQVTQEVEKTQAAQVQDVFQCAEPPEWAAVFIFVYRKWIPSALIQVDDLSKEPMARDAECYDICITHQRDNIYLIT